ncbi:MAG: alcohol dehydrogenase catalytic domain-containing protein [Sandaracinaceae bacterium]|nr:alcohol dehydrogenase catalytic domain-containing protein [Sandaracinaceae bacterium]
MQREGMRAWWREGALRFGVRAVPRLAASDDVSVRVVIAGLCRTDVAVARGQLACAEPCVLGHEVAGVVEEVGPAVRGLAPGDRVACLPRVDAARVGVDRDGGFAERLVLPERALARIPSGLDWRRAALVEPVAACLAVKRAPLAGRVRVLGRGRIAALTRRVVVALGHACVERDADVVIETEGTAASLAEAMATAPERGLVVLKSRPPAPIAFDVAQAVTRELRLFAVGWASFEDAFALLPSLRVDDLLGPVFPLDALGDLLAAPDDKKLFLAPEPDACAA